MPSVLHVLAPADGGGMESVVHLLAGGLAAVGTPVHAHVITVPGHRPPLTSVLEDVGVDVHVTEVAGRRYGFERERTRELCRSLGIDVVHTHGYRPDVIDAPAARGAGRPVVSTVHGFTGGGWKNAVYEWLQIRSLRRMDRVLAVSRPLMELLTRRGVPASALRL
ncbi:MAG: glycosyltransferase, partial [Longimicrobiales bacterium]